MALQFICHCLVPENVKSFFSRMTTTLDELIIAMLKALSSILSHFPPVLLYLGQTDKQVKGSLLLHHLSLNCTILCHGNCVSYSFACTEKGITLMLVRTMDCGIL